MYISKLYLKNFKTIVEETFYFSNINIIAGLTGEGKSAVLEAIAFCLTGKLKDNISEYVRWKQKEFIIEIYFDHHSINYKYSIVGSIKSTTNRSLIINNDEENAFKNSDAVKELETIIDSELTMYSNISMQHRSTELLEENPAPRLQKLKKILKVDRLNTCVEKVDEDREIVKENIIRTKAEKDILDNKTFSYEDIPELPAIDIEELQNKDKEFNILKQTYEKEKLEYEKYLVHLEQYNINRKKYDIAKKESEKNNKILETLRASLKEEPDFDIEYFNNLNSSVRVAKTLETKLKNKKNELDSLPKPKRIEKIEITDDSISESIKDRDEWKTAYMFNKKTLDAVEKGTCPTCGTLFESNDIEDIRKLYNLHLDNYNTAKQKVDEEKKILEDYNKKIEENNEIIRNRKYIQKEIDELKKELLELNVDFSLYEKLLKIKDEYDEAIKHNKRLKIEINDYEKKEIALNSEIKSYNLNKPEEFVISINYNGQEHDKLKEQISDYLTKISEKDRIEKFNKKIKEEENLVKQKLLDKEKEIIDLSKKENDLKIIKSILEKEFASYLIEKGTTKLKNDMNNFFQRGYGKYTVEFKQNKKGIDYYYSENGDDLHSVNTLSGFESQVLGTAQRVALTGLQDLKIFVADEIDSDAPASKSINLFQALLNEKFNQYFIISHDDEVKEYLTNQGGKEFCIHAGSLIQ